MAVERASIFGGDEELDVSDFNRRPAEEVRPPVDKKTLRAVGEQHGFVSREPGSANSAPPLVVAAPTPRAPRASTPSRPAATYTAKLSVRVRQEDKQRFDDLGYRLRVPAGETLTKMLDLYEAAYSSDPETASLAAKLVAKLVA